MAVDESYKYSEITDKVIKAFYTVYNTLGYGFLEKVYENAMMIELRKMGLEPKAQPATDVYYDDQKVGKYSCDIEVNECIILELKANTCLVDENVDQLLNFLRATDKEVGLVMNFGRKPEFKKKIFTNDFKERYLNQTE